jgi:hypothetical protein
MRQPPDAWDPRRGEYLINRGFKAPVQTTPGTKMLTGEYVNQIGPGGVRVELWTAYYDEYGRLIGRTDYNAGNVREGIPSTHHTIATWGPGCNPWGPGCNPCYIDHLPGEYIP